MCRVEHLTLLSQRPYNTTVSGSLSRLHSPDDDAVQWQTKLASSLVNSLMHINLSNSICGWPTSECESIHKKKNSFVPCRKCHGRLPPIRRTTSWAARVPWSRWSSPGIRSRWPLPAVSCRSLAARRTERPSTASCQTWGTCQGAPPGTEPAPGVHASHFPAHQCPPRSPSAPRRWSHAGRSGWTCQEPTVSIIKSSPKFIVWRLKTPSKNNNNNNNMATLSMHASSMCTITSYSLIKNVSLVFFWTHLVKDWSPWVAEVMSSIYMVRRRQMIVDHISTGLHEGQWGHHDVLIWPATVKAGSIVSG